VPRTNWKSDFRILPTSFFRLFSSRRSRALIPSFLCRRLWISPGYRITSGNCNCRSPCYPSKRFFRVESQTPRTFCRYSTNQDISRARQAFFSGKKSFLIVSERFHFYRRSAFPTVFSFARGYNQAAGRYKIRGIRNLIFYGPPDHAAFYTEFLSYPFLDDGVEPSDVTCRVLYSRYDWFRMERIAGTKGARQLIKSSGP
jgi:hypothetical protein